MQLIKQGRDLTNMNRWTIDLDGLASHAQGQISQQGKNVTDSNILRSDNNEEFQLKQNYENPIDDL